MLNLIRLPYGLSHYNIHANSILSLFSRSNTQQRLLQTVHFIAIQFSLLTYYQTPVALITIIIIIIIYLCM